MQFASEIAGRGFATHLKHSPFINSQIVVDYVLVFAELINLNYYNYKNNNYYYNKLIII